MAGGALRSLGLRPACGGGGRACDAALTSRARAGGGALGGLGEAAALCRAAGGGGLCSAPCCCCSGELTGTAPVLALLLAPEALKRGARSCGGGRCCRAFWVLEGVVPNVVILQYLPVPCACKWSVITERAARS